MAALEHCQFRVRFAQRRRGRDDESRALTRSQHTLRNQALAGFDDTRLAEQITPGDLPYGGQPGGRRDTALHNPVSHSVDDLLHDRHHCLSVNSQFHELANSCQFCWQQ